MLTTVLQHYRFNVFSWLLFLATGVALFLVAVLWSRRRTSLAAVFLALTELAIANWCFAIAFEIAATTVRLKFVWSVLAYPGTVYCPLLFFLFALTYLARGRYLTGRNILILLIIPTLTLLAAITNPWHRLLWRDIIIQPENNIAVYVHGAWFYIFVFYTYLLLITGLMVIYFGLFQFPRHNRARMMFWLGVSVIPIIGNLVYLTRSGPIVGLDWTPVSFLVTSLILIFGIWRLKVIDVIPIARNLLVDSIQDAVFVVDREGHILDMNPAMERVSGIQGGQAIGRYFQTIFAHLDQMVVFCQEQSAIPQEIIIPAPEGRRVVELSQTPVNDRRGEPVGRLFVLHDITLRKQLENDREQLIGELREALGQVKTLKGLLPTCSNCKRIKDEHGNWHHMEIFIRDHSEADFSHGICPDCMQKLYPDYMRKKN